MQYDYEKRYKELNNNLNQTFNNYLKSFYIENILPFIKKKGNDKINILDIGCGCGYLTGIIKDNYKNATIYGIDCSIDEINVAKKYQLINYFSKYL